MPDPMLPDATNPAAQRPLQPGEAELGAKQLEAVNFAKAKAPGDPNGQQIIASQYLYKKYGILPNNGQGDWQHGSGGPLGWEIVNGDLVPKDRSWWDKYGMTMVAAGILTAGTASAFLGPAAASATTTAPTIGEAASGFGPLAGGYGAATTTAAAPAGIAAASAPVAGGAGMAGSNLFGVPSDDIFKAGVSLFGNLFGAHLQSSANDNAAAMTAAAAKYAADLQAKATSDALAFQGASAENAFQNNEAARQGNYAQDAAHQRRLGTIGEEVGLGPREIPAYVPGVDPHFGNAPASSSTGAGPAAASTGDPLMDALTKNYAALGVSPTGPGSGPTDIAYMAGKIKETGGLTPDNMSYWFGPNGRIAKELAQAKGGASMQGAPVARTAAPSVSDTPFMPMPIAAGVPQSIGYYA